MKKILSILAILSLTACSAVDMGVRHRAEKKELRMEAREEIRPIEEKYNKDLKKLKGKQSLEFGVWLAGKGKALKDLFE